MLGWQGWCPRSWLSVCPPAGEGEASTCCLWALCVSLGLDSDCSALLGSSGGCGFVLLPMPYCVSLRTWMHFFSLRGVWPFRLLSVHVSVFMPHM